MEINKINTNITFGKTLAAKAAIVGKWGSEPCNIYKLNLPEDAGYYYKMLKTNPDWAECRFVGLNMKEFLANQKNMEFFVLEDSSEQGLGYVTIEHYTNSEKKKNTNVEFLETCPAYIGQKRKREKKYIGETLLAFIAAKSKKENKYSVRIPSPTSSALPFYRNNCGFRDEEVDKALVLHSDKFDTLLKDNAKHTDCKVELIG